MKAFALCVLFVLTGGFLFAEDPVPYDSAKVKEVMRSNSAQIAVISKGITASDWAAVTTGFSQFLKNGQEMKAFAAPKGDAKDWARIWDEFIKAATAGIEAAKAKDPVAAKKHLDELTGDRNEGHPKYR